MRHLLEIDDLAPGEFARVLELTADPEPEPVLAGQGVALVFEKPSARTRNSMEMAVAALGGHPVYIQAAEVGLDERESVEDVAATLACYHRFIGARVLDHSTVERMAAVGAAPVVNLLSDRAHPMQALADLATLAQELGPLEGRRLAYVGDANNTARSLVIAAAMARMEVAVAGPPGYGFDPPSIDRIRAAGCDPVLTDDPAEAVAGADAVYTDVWTSMGQEAETARRLEAFEGYTVDEDLMAGARPGAVFLHCLPARRGEEVAAEVIDGPRSRVWAQAANRMHAARGLLMWLADANAGSAFAASASGPASAAGRQRPAASGSPASEGERR